MWNRLEREGMIRVWIWTEKKKNMNFRVLFLQGLQWEGIFLQILPRFVCRFLER